MMNRRKALQVLGTAGIGTAVFQRSLAAKADVGPVTPQMVGEAEWVAGITLTPAQREAAVKSLNKFWEPMQRVRAIELDNSQPPGLLFRPLTTPGSEPDRRSDQIAPPAQRAEAARRPATDEDLAFSSVRKLGALLRSREISSVELTMFYLDRLRRYDPLLKCVVTLMDDLAIKQAKQADREMAEKKDRGPLHGIPWGLKDVIAYPGYPTTWCAPQYRDRIIDVKAAVAERLEDAGAVLIAKLASNPFAGGGQLWFRGMTRCPWNPQLSAAGSSSGPGSATAAGLLGFSIGTDTSGSLINPAIRCGAVGVRPSYGRVSRYGCMQLCWSLDTIGPICRTADDCGLVLSAIHGSDPRDVDSLDRPYVWPSARDLSTIRVGYTPQKEEADTRDELGVLRDLGVQLVPIQSPNPLEDYGLTFELIEGVVAIESGASFDELVRQGGPKGVHGWPRYWSYGHLLSAVDYLKLNRLRAVLMQRLAKLMESIDVYLGFQLALYTNLAGHPVMAFPTQLEEKNGALLPRGQMLVGRVYDESTMLAVADACQRAIGLNNRPPLEEFLAQKEEILKDEEFPDETRLYTD